MSSASSRLPAISISRNTSRPCSSSKSKKSPPTRAALYRAARVGGDFFDFELLHGRLVFLLIDIAGKRDEALDIAAAVQETFHATAAELVRPAALNEEI